METVFLKILNMSITASWIVLAVVILRLVLKKAPKWITCLLWILVAVRLVCPVSIESILSLIPSAEPVSPELVYADIGDIGDIGTGINVSPNAENNIIYNTNVPESMSHMTNMQVITLAASILWIVGIALMLLYAFISYLRVRRRVLVSILIEDNIYLCDHINTPFILGIIKPRIYLPSELSEGDREYVIAHENAHLKRKDHLWKPLGFLLLSVYWFNPVLWLAYILLCRDIELACDEKVIKEMGEESKKDYSCALLSCSIPRKMISACPLAFGEVGVKQRIKSVLNYKKPAFWVSIVALILCIGLAVGFLTNPVSSNAQIVTSGSEYEGISMDIVSLDLESDNPTIEIKWINKTPYSFTCGEPFNVYQNLDGYLKDCAASEMYFISIGYIIPAFGSFTHTYSLKNINFAEAGTYRFVSGVIKDGGDKGGKVINYDVWVEFEVPEISDCSMEDVSAEIVSINTHDKSSPYIEILWHNNSESTLVIGEGIDVYRLKNGEWKSCIGSGYGYEEIAYLINPHSDRTQRYSLSNIDVSEAGTYRFVWNFYEEGSNTDTLHNLKIEYRISDALTNAEELFIDDIAYDIDNDGEKEILTLSHTSTSAKAPFILSVEETDGSVTHRSAFSSPVYDLSFVEDKFGTVYVQGITKGDNPVAHIYNISALENGSVVLERDNSTLPYYEPSADSEMYLGSFYADADMDGVQEHWYIQRTTKNSDSISEFSLSAYRYGMLLHFDRFAVDSCDKVILEETDEGSLQVVFVTSSGTNSYEVKEYILNIDGETMMLKEKDGDGIIFGANTAIINE